MSCCQLIDKLAGKLNSISVYLSSKKIYSKPHKKDVLIFDRTASNIIIHYFNECNVEILDTRRESVNVCVLLKMFVSLDFSLKNYIKIYCEFVKPKVIITYIDNNELFYDVSKIYPFAKTICIQNGWRDMMGTFCNDEHLKAKQRLNYAVDYMLVQNRHMASRYGEYISANYITIGSFLLNQFLPKQNSKSNIVGFVSQYRAKSNSLMYVNTCNNYKITWENFYRDTPLILKMLENFCIQNNLQLAIISAAWNADDKINEKQYFEDILGNDAFLFLEKQEKTDGYQNAYGCEYVVAIDSQLSYEMLTLNKKVGIFSNRLTDVIGDESNRFGWMQNLPRKGAVWSDEINQEEFDRIMNYIITISDEEYLAEIQKFKDDIMEYDKGNTKFIALMKELGVPLKGEFYE